MISPHAAPRAGRAAGAVIGSAVGDALGAPFEFGPAGVFSARFPDGVGTLCGGGGWDPGEATDDTQMAVLVGESLLERGGLELPDVFDRFRRWAAGEPKDIGLQTEDVLTNGEPWDLAAGLHFQVNGRAAGNGSLMRATTSAVYFAPAGRTATMEAARRIAALTHGDRAAWEGHRGLPRAGPDRPGRGRPARRRPGHARRGPPGSAPTMGNGPGPRLAPRPGDRVQRRGLALPGHRPVGPAHDGHVRVRAGRRRGRGRGHRHGRRRDGRPGRRGVRHRRRTGPLDRAPARTAAGVRGPDAADTGSARPRGTSEQRGTQGCT